jgi:hypothetical protein
MYMSQSRVEQAPKAQCMLACAIKAVWHKEACSIGHGCMQEYVSVLCAKSRLASQLCGKGKAAARGVQLRCTRKHVFYNAHM